jgi:hypothetical protein
MKGLMITLVLVAAVAAGVDALGDLTQSRPDEIEHGAATEVVLSVDEDRFRAGEDAAAATLWGVCGAQTASQVVGGGGPEAIGDGRYRVVLEPAVGDHERRKLVGCLEDLTVDRVMGDVESFETFALEP